MATLAPLIKAKTFGSPETTRAVIMRELRSDFEDWMMAKEDLYWHPPFEMAEKDHAYMAKVTVAGVNPRDIEVLAAPDIMLIKAKFGLGKLTRSIEFPKPIDPGRVRAELKDGLLRITAEMVEEHMPLLLAA
jgi:HSP20 family molecular chaperone IbpA